MSDEQLTDDALNRRAAELMGGACIEDIGGTTVWYPPGPRGSGRVRIPIPATDHGDALRLLEFVSAMETTETILIRTNRKSAKPRGCRISLTTGDDWYPGYADTLPLAVTRACVAALEIAKGETAK